ncbi:MAG: hypothetical protein NT149_01460 [Candidatus Gottesmanbacteria bacterium]|nr:hypothetical protein [Candidatus Gottesmanbacteria bacterium]
MSIKEKYKPIAEKETRKKLASQRKIDERQRKEGIIAITKEKQRNERERIRKQRIQEIINRSGIKEMMKEAADVKRGWVVSEDDGSKLNINSRWSIDVNTGEPISPLKIKWSSNNYPSYEITSHIEAGSITIEGSQSRVIKGIDMYDRDILERAIIKALANPHQGPDSNPPPQNNYPSW